MWWYDISTFRKQSSRSSKLFSPRPDLYACKQTLYAHPEESGLPKDLQLQEWKKSFRGFHLRIQLQVRSWFHFLYTLSSGFRADKSQRLMRFQGKPWNQPETQLWVYLQNMPRKPLIHTFLLQAFWRPIKKYNSNKKVTYLINLYVPSENCKLYRVSLKIHGSLLSSSNAML